MRADRAPGTSTTVYRTVFIYFPRWAASDESDRNGSGEVKRDAGQLSPPGRRMGEGRRRAGLTSTQNTKIPSFIQLFKNNNNNADNTLDDNNSIWSVMNTSKEVSYFSIHHPTSFATILGGGKRYRGKYLTEALISRGKIASEKYCLRVTRPTNNQRESQGEILPRTVGNQHAKPAKLLR